MPWYAALDASSGAFAVIASIQLGLHDAGGCIGLYLGGVLYERHKRLTVPIFVPCVSKPVATALAVSTMFANDALPTIGLAVQEIPAGGQVQFVQPGSPGGSGGNSPRRRRHRCWATSELRTRKA